MFKNKKVVAVLVLLAFAVSLFFVGYEPATKVDASQKKTILRFMWWGGDARHKATLAAIQAYQKKYPNVRINAEYGGIDGYLQKLITQLVGKTAPDVIQIDVTWIDQFTSQGDFFADLKQFKEVNLSTFEQSFLNNFCYVNGKLIGLPTGVNASTMQFNKDFFKRFGIPEDTAWDWDNLVQIAQKVHQKDKNSYLLNMDTDNCIYLLKSYILQKTGGNWINDNYTLGFDRKTLIDGFTYLDKLFKVGAIQPFSESAPFDLKPDQNPKWLKGQLGMMMNWVSTYPANKANLPSLSLTLPPLGKNAKSSAIAVRPSQLLAVNKLSKNAKEAAKFINWFLNDKQAAQILVDVRGIPASSSARDILAKTNKLDPVMVKVTDESVKRAAKPENALSQNQEIADLTRDVVRQLAYHQLNPTQAADKLISVYLQKLAEFKSQGRR